MRPEILPVKTIALAAFVSLIGLAVLVFSAKASVQCSAQAAHAAADSAAWYGEALHFQPGVLLEDNRGNLVWNTDVAKSLSKKTRNH